MNKGSVSRFSKQDAPDEINIKKIFLTVIAVYVVLIVGFYFLAGDQLRYRESHGNFSMLPAETGTAELAGGTVVEQTVRVKIQRLERVSVQFGASYRANSGTVLMELLPPDSEEPLLQAQFDAAGVSEGQILTMSAETPIETIYDVPLILRLSSDSAPGSAVTPLASTRTEDGLSMRINGETVPGTLCFSAEGTDYIWTGIHYWAFSAALGAAILLLFLAVWLRFLSGKHSYVVYALVAMKKYRFLIRQLVLRDFKTKYKRSILGVFWSFLNPLLMMIVQYFVFSTIFKNAIQNFAVYLLVGVVMFNFFSESCGMTLNSILGNAGLITKVYMPKYIYPLTRTMSSMVNLAISLLPLIAVCLVTGVHFQKSALLSLFFFVCLIIFCLGLGMLLSTSMVFFRDTQFLWNVLSMMWMYATPIFYPESILPDNLRFVLELNPLYFFIKSARMCIIDGLSPEPFEYFRCLIVALVMLVIGAWVFKRNQDKFILYM